MESDNGDERPRSELRGIYPYRSSASAIQMGRRHDDRHFPACINNST
jgi:hypothetical protein